MERFVQFPGAEMKFIGSKKLNNSVTTNEV